MSAPGAGMAEVTGPALARPAAVDPTRAEEDWRAVQATTTTAARAYAGTLDASGDTRGAQTARDYAAGIEAEGVALIALIRAGCDGEVAPARAALVAALDARDAAARRLGLSVPTALIRAGAELVAASRLVRAVQP